MRWYLDLLHKPVFLQTPLDRCYLVVPTLLLIVLIAVVKVYGWDEWQQRRRGLR